jgi:hypothetical protein
VLGELGLLGALALGALLYCFWRNWLEARRLHRSGPNRPRDFAFYVSRAVAMDALLLCFLGWSGHNLYRYNWQWFAAFQAMFKFDLRTQLHGLTIYSTGDSPEDAVLLVYADFDRDHLATLAKGANDYKGSEHNQHVIHSWVDNSKKNHHDGRTYAATHGSRVLVFGQRESSVAKALDVFDLSAANLTASKTFPTLNSGTAFIQAAAQKLSISGSDPNAAVFRLSKSIRFEVGEDQKQVKATLQLTAGDEDVAKQIGSIGQGLIALIRLQKDRPEAGKLADSLTLKQDGTDVTVTLSIPSGDAVDFMKAEAARRAKKTE